MCWANLAGTPADRELHRGGGGGLKSGGVTSEEEGAAFITGFSLREGIRFGVVIKKKSHNVSFEKGRM